MNRSPNTAAMNHGIQATNISWTAIDPRSRWILQRLLASADGSLPPAVPVDFLTSLTIADLQSVKGVGPLRAARVLTEVQDLLSHLGVRQHHTTATRSDHAGPLLTLTRPPSYEHLPLRLREAISRLRLDLSGLPQGLQSALQPLADSTDAASIPLAAILAIDNACLSEAGFPPSNAIALLALRDEMFSLEAVNILLQEQSDPSCLVVALYLQIAVATRWAFQEWGAEAGVDADALLDSLRHIERHLSPPKAETCAVYRKDLIIAQRALRGETLRTIANAFGVTRERIRQRLRRVGIRTPDVKKAKHAARERTLRALRPQVETYVRSHPGCFLYEVIEATGASADCVEEAMRDVSWLVLTESDADLDQVADLPSVVESKARALAALRNASTFCFPITRNAYDDLIRKKLVAGPSGVRIMQVFGTWRTACDAAGVESGKEGVAPGQTSTWTYDEVLEQVGDFFLATGYQGTTVQYEDWRASANNNHDIPSFGTVRNVLGNSWAQVRHRVLFALRRRWQKVGHV
jgi:hypothetical protein